MTSAPPSGGRWGEEQRRREEELLRAWAATSAEDPTRTAIRDELVTMHLPLVRHLAGRYRGRGESMDDLVQIGAVGLIKAVDGFDPDRGAQLATYATPTILGEIRRHFRDRAWAVRVPRRMQELHLQVTARADALTQELQRPPTVRELADSLDLTQDEILDALEARHALVADSLDATREDGSPVAAITEPAFDDPRFEAIDDREVLIPLLDALPERERTVVVLRFFDHLSQSQIAERLGISQMHVSRLQARALATLREGVSAA